MQRFKRLSVILCIAFCSLEAGAVDWDKPHPCGEWKDQWMHGSHGKYFVDVSFRAKGSTCYATASYNNGAGDEVYVAETTKEFGSA